MQWPELGIAVRVRPLSSNREAYHWFLSNLPVKGVQSHAAVSGRLLYVLNLVMGVAPTFSYLRLARESLAKEPVGRVSLFITAGLVGSIMVKYGEITEDMSYPTIGQVEGRDINRLEEAGRAVWSSLYKTKEVITVMYSEAR